VVTQGDEWGGGGALGAQVGDSLIAQNYLAGLFTEVALQQRHGLHLTQRHASRVHVMI
jgi:hypothetical protein